MQNTKQSIRRVRRRSEQAPVDEIDFKNRKDLSDLVDQVVARQQELTHAALHLADAEARLLRLMQAMKIAETKQGNYIATVERPQGRATRTVDPKAFHELVDSDKDFYNAVSVSITEAKKLLPEKTLGKIITTTPGKPGEPRVKVVEAKADAKIKAK